MGTYRKVVLTENDATVSNHAETSQDAKLKRFDNTYTSKKLNDLYRQFDSITVSGTDLENDIDNDVSVSKAVAIRQKLSFSTKLYITSTVLVVALMLFLAIYNIFVINTISNSINVVNEEVTITEQQLQDAYNTYKTLSNTNKWSDQSKEVLSGIQTGASIPMLESVTITEQSSETNWFDILCNFFSNIFGG